MISTLREPWRLSPSRGAFILRITLQMNRLRLILTISYIIQPCLHKLRIVTTMHVRMWQIPGGLL